MDFHGNRLTVIKDDSLVIAVIAQPDLFREEGKGELMSSSFLLSRPKM